MEEWNPSRAHSYGPDRMADARIDIRPYVAGDRGQVLQIHFDTGFLGRSMAEVVTRREEYNEDLLPYLDDYPEYCFVADDGGRIAGYVLGRPHDSTYQAAGGTLKKALRLLVKLPFMPDKDRSFWAGWLSFLYRAATGQSEEPKLAPPPGSGHLHINLRQEYRGKGLGSRLLKAFLDHARSRGLKVIHADSFDTRLNPNHDFWIKNGFQVHTRARTSFWKKQLPDEPIQIICYMKEL